jgi:hypothetical protein
MDSQQLPTDPFQRDSPNAFINLLPHGAAVQILAAYKAKPELFGLTERQLYKLLKDKKARPDPTDNRLRLQFWQEYDIACQTRKRMFMGRVTAGVCNENYLYEKYMSKPERVAWLTCMPATYDTFLTEALHFGMEQLRDVLELDHVLKNGKIDTKLLELKAKITFALDARKNGGIIQRVEQKQMNLNISTSDKKVAQAALGGTMEDMEKRIRQLEKEERKLLGLKDDSTPEPRSVESEVAD